MISVEAAGAQRPLLPENNPSNRAKRRSAGRRQFPFPYGRREQTCWRINASLSPLALSSLAFITNSLCLSHADGIQVEQQEMVTPEHGHLITEMPQRVNSTRAESLPACLVMFLTVRMHGLTAMIAEVAGVEEAMPVEQTRAFRFEVKQGGKATLTLLRLYRG